MTLRAAAQAVGYTGPDTSCKFGVILRGLDDDDRAYFEQMRAEGAPAATIARAFRADNHPISNTTLKDHLRGECSCR